MREYEVIIIGSGLSGLAAGIRLAHYGKKVLLLEQHSRIGGMNSWYRRQGREYDVGLHAMTNFQLPGQRSGPLTKLLRQLRLRYQDLDLAEQNYSLIEFPQAKLRFTNDFSDLTTSIKQLFPDQLDGFEKLTEQVKQFNRFSLDPPSSSARQIVKENIANPLLREMLFCPIMYYGNAQEHDMDFAQFCIMFQSIFMEGFCRPRQGMRGWLELLSRRYRQAGGELSLNNRVRALHATSRSITKIELASGEMLSAQAVISCAGYPETMSLCKPPGENSKLIAQSGKMSFVEGIFVFNRPITEIASDATIIFYSRQTPFQYHRPNHLLDLSSGVVCLPDNFTPTDPEWQQRGESRIRVTAIANYDKWSQLDQTAYHQAKQESRDFLLDVLTDRFPRLKSHLIDDDLFTPMTIERYTARRGGAVYGSPVKHRNGRTPFDNLFICGSDQGFLGIVGALLSGVSMANYHFFR